MWVMRFLEENFSLKNPGFDGFSLRMLAYCCEKSRQAQKMGLIAFATETLAAPVELFVLSA